MAKPDNKEEAERKLRPEDEGYVGRGHPPKHTRIKPGEVRNRHGRRGKPKPGTPPSDFATDMTRLLSQPVKTKDGHTYSHAEVVHNSLLKLASAGDPRGVRLFLELVEKYGPRPAGHDLTEPDSDDEAILADYEREVLEASATKVTLADENGQNDV